MSRAFFAKLHTAPCLKRQLARPLACRENDPKKKEERVERLYERDMNRIQKLDTGVMNPVWRP